MKNQAAVALGKLSRRRLTAKRRREIARTAARTRWANVRLTREGGSDAQAGK